MTPREMILAAIRHEEVWPVPYTLSFEESVGERMDARYGGSHWRERMVMRHACKPLIGYTSPFPCCMVYRTPWASQPASRAKSRAVPSLTVAVWERTTREKRSAVVP